MSLAQDSLAASLVDNSHTVAAAATTLSPSTTTTTGSTATSRTRASTTRTRLSTTRIPGGASATTASPSATRTGTHTGHARGGTTRGTWCYTTGWDNNCGDLQRSNRFQNNPWSYRACGNQG